MRSTVASAPGRDGDHGAAALFRHGDVAVAAVGRLDHRALRPGREVRVVLGLWGQSVPAGITKSSRAFPSQETSITISPCWPAAGPSMVLCTMSDPLASGVGVA